jgi:hypothetical protein
LAKAHFAVRSARPGFAVLNNVRAAAPILRRRCCWRHTRMLCAKRPAKRCDRAMGEPASSQPALPRACTRRPKVVFFSLRARLPTVSNEGQRSPDPSARKQGRKRADPKCSPAASRHERALGHSQRRIWRLSKANCPGACAPINRVRHRPTDRNNDGNFHRSRRGGDVALRAPTFSIEVITLPVSDVERCGSMSIRSASRSTSTIRRTTRSASCSSLLQAQPARSR